MNQSNDYSNKRLALAQIAYQEGLLELSGDEHMAGEAIEKYLSLLREVFNANGNCDKYSDTRVGYQWCCAFAYYCCLQAGFVIPPKPVLESRFTLGAVPAWYEWAILPENDFYFPVDDLARAPEAGDIVLFSHLLEDVDLDHIGIVVSVSPTEITSAEGNYKNRSGLFQRSRVDCINGYIRLNKF